MLSTGGTDLYLFLAWQLRRLTIASRERLTAKAAAMAAAPMPHTTAAATPAAGADVGDDAAGADVGDADAAGAGGDAEQRTCARSLLRVGLKVHRGRGIVEALPLSEQSSFA